MGSVTAIALEPFLAPLKSIVGDDYACIRGGTILASPGDAGEIAEVLRFAQGNELAVMPTGGGTKLPWGNPVKATIEMNLRRLSDLREHAWQDLTCTVQAGCSWAAMQSQLAQHGQMVALDPLWPEHATVGGIIASNDSGALRLKFGGLRDLIIGMTVVLADGIVARSGGKVVKNVAGYDLHKLMTGSFGTLGVIAEVNFRLHPAEHSARTWSIASREEKTPLASAYAESLLAFLDSQIDASCVQIRASAEACALDIRVAGIPECFDEYESQIRRIFDGFEITASDEIIWQERQRIFDSEFEFILKISAVPNEICTIISELQQWARAQNTKLVVAGQATGIITAGWSGPPAASIALIERLRERASTLGGGAVLQRMPEALRGELDVWGMQANALPLMREIKRRFDPGRILNPGRFVGNI